MTEKMTYPNEYIDELISEADSAITRNEPKEAKNILNEILSIEPAFSVAHNYLGWLYMYYFHNYTLAESHLRLAIKFAPAYPPAFQNLGALKVMMKQYDEAEEILRQGLSYGGSNVMYIYEELGKIYELRGKLFLARRYYKMAIKNCMDNDYMEDLRKHLRRCRLKIFLF